MAVDKYLNAATSGLPATTKKGAYVLQLRVDNCREYRRPAPGWRAFDAEQREKRARGVRPSSTCGRQGLVTEIDQYNRDIRGADFLKTGAALGCANGTRASIASSWKGPQIALELDRIASYLGLARFHS